MLRMICPRWENSLHPRTIAGNTKYGQKRCCRRNGSRAINMEENHEKIICKRTNER